jgi:hypothetical protein
LHKLADAERFKIRSQEAVLEVVCCMQAALRAQKSSAAVAEEQVAAERAEAEARQHEAAAKAAVREAALVVQRRYRARKAAEQASDLANRQKVTV